MKSLDDERADRRREEDEIQAAEILTLLFAITMIMGLSAFIFESYIRLWLPAQQ